VPCFKAEISAQVLSKFERTDFVSLKKLHDGVINISHLKPLILV
jgi:hypothetical protein